jgi:hypothetical protein
VEIPYIGEEEEEFQSSPVTEKSLSPTQTGSCVESTTPCTSPQLDITIEDLSKSIVFSQGGKSNSHQSSGSSVDSQSQN